MRRIDGRLIAGLLLIALGVIFLLQQLGLAGWAWLVPGLVTAVGAAFFLAIVIRDRQHWWALIPGSVLVGMTAAAVLNAVAPSAVADTWSGPAFLASVGLGFLAVYLVNAGQWWAIIPGGVLLTLAAVAGLRHLGAWVNAGVFFAGLGLTFWLLALAPTPAGRMGWAIYPGAALLVLGGLLALGFEAALEWVLPAAFILAGGYLLLRSFTRRRAAP